MTPAELIRQCREALEYNGLYQWEETKLKTAAIRAIDELEQAFGKQDQLDQQDATTMGDSVAPYKSIADLGFCAAAWQALAEERGEILRDIMADMPPKIDARLKYCEMQFTDAELDEIRTVLSTTPADALARRDERIKALGAADYLEAAAVKRWTLPYNVMHAEAAALRQKAGE